ncbi:MAG: carbohydrate kinase family protein [Lachnospiraceae bacterium]|nr:carbohydrate kinase family protein [Lachnospiraceae bacterium]
MKTHDNKSTKKVIVAGHICLDITPAFSDPGKTSISDILQPGKLIETKGIRVSTGGAVANTGLAMKLFRADVRLMGKTGTDELGDMICSILKKYDADKDMIRASNETSSYSVVLAIPGIDRIFLHCPGTNNTFTSSDIPDDALKDAALFHFGYPPIMKRMYENNGAELIALFDKVRKNGCAISLDMAAVDPNSEAGRADWKSILQEVIPLTDFFVPSIEELCFMLDRDRFEEWQQRAKGKDITGILDVDKDIRPLADICMDMGCRVLMLKCGAPGLYYRSAKAEKLNEIPKKAGLDISAWADREGFERSYKPDAILSGTGAGDTCIAAFLTAMLEGNNPDECIKLAAATGACCVSAYDALSGLKPLDDLREKIRSGWEKN